MGIALLIASLIMNSTANVLIKIGSANMSYLKTYGPILGLIKNWPFTLGVALFGINVFVYALALSKIPLSIAYPVLSVGGLIIITAISALYFKETLNTVQMVGMLLLIIGIVLIAQK